MPGKAPAASIYLDLCQLNSWHKSRPLIGPGWGLGCGSSHSSPLGSPGSELQLPHARHPCNALPHPHHPAENYLLWQTQDSHIGRLVVFETVCMLVLQVLAGIGLVCKAQKASALSLSLHTSYHEVMQFLKPPSIFLLKIYLQYNESVLTIGSAAEVLQDGYEHYNCSEIFKCSC